MSSMKEHCKTAVGGSSPSKASKGAVPGSFYRVAPGRACAMPAKNRAEGLLSQPSAAVLANDTAAALVQDSALERAAGRVGRVQAQAGAAHLSIVRPDGG